MWPEDEIMGIRRIRGKSFTLLINDDISEAVEAGRKAAQAAYMHNQIDAMNGAFASAKLLFDNVAS